MQQKWYKQFWPWFLIVIPLSSMIVGTLVVYLATTGQDSLVSDDYYKEGKAINLDITKVKKARQLGLVGLMRISEDNLSLEFESRLPPDSAAIKAQFFHTTLATEDFSVMLTKDAKNRFSGTLPTNLNGKWRVTISAFDDSWKIQKRVGLPNSSVIRFEP
ncbi:MAG: FixH family protein [Aestuariibacter sp.]